MMKETLDFIRKNLSFWQANNLNEAQTCQSIILGILYELKYDIWNPFEIFPQDTNTRGAGRPDYLICLNDQEKFVIEVKALNKDFSDAEYTQAVNYVNAKGLHWAILTNGIKWLFFDNLIKGTIKQKLVLELDINDGYFENHLTMLLDRNIWLTKNVNEEVSKKISLIHLLQNILSKKDEGYEKSDKGLRLLVKHELDNSFKKLIEENFDFLLTFYLDTDKQQPIQKNEKNIANQIASKNEPIDLFAAIVSTFKGEESGRKQVKLKVAYQDIAFLSWKDVHLAIAETLVKLDKIVELERLAKIIEKDQRDLNTYTESVYMQLSNGKYIYLSYSAEDHKKHIKPLLEVLGFSIEITYRDNLPISLS